jgi:hypothetical protein
MYGINGYFGYPNQFQVMANPTGAGLASLNSEFAKDFGLSLPPVYDLPLDVNMGYNNYMQSPGMYGMTYPPYMMDKNYIKYLNMDYVDRIAYDQKVRDAARESQYIDGISSRDYASATDGLTGSIREACNTLQTVIVEGESDQIVLKFEEIVKMIKQSPVYERLQEQFKNNPEALDKTIRNCAKEQFMAVTGQDLKAMIQQHCDGALENSFWNTLSFGNAQTHSAEEIIAKIEGSQTPRSVKTKERFGKLGGVTSYTLAGAAIGCIGGPVGAGIGATIGCIAGIVGSIAQ